MNVLKRLLMWLARRGGTGRMPDLPLLPAPPDCNVAEYDAALLERVRLQWMMGDWQALARLERDNVTHHPERGQIAAYVGAGLQQLGRHQEAQHWLEDAKIWGCARRLLAEILLSGVYYTLARAALVAGDRPRALRNLKESLEVGMPGHDVGLLARARISAQAQIPGVLALEWGSLEDLDELKSLTADDTCDPILVESAASI